MHVAAVVLAAGKGLRFSSARFKVPKPLVAIRGRPLIIYSLETLSRHPGIKDIILVVNPKNSGGIAEKARKYRIGKIKKLVFGGHRRQDSVANGLKHVNPKAGLVLIHDGVRPFINKEIVSSVIKEARKSGAAITGVPVKGTIKEVARSGSHQVTSNFIVKKTLNRDALWEAQTPQVFRKDLILKAYKRFGREEVTDDASLVEKLGAKVSVVLGSYNNIKITTPEDLVIAKAIAKKLIDKRNAYCRCPTE